MTTKQEIFKEKLQEYLKTSKEEKGRILDAVCSVSGVHRKTAIHRFRSLQRKDPSISKRRGRTRIYTNNVTAALKEIWDVAHQICGERFHPMISEYVRVLKRDKMWQYDEETTALLLKISMATVKRRVAKLEKERGLSEGQIVLVTVTRPNITDKEIQDTWKWIQKWKRFNNKEATFYTALVENWEKPQRRTTGIV